MPTMRISGRSVAEIEKSEKPVTFYDDALRGFGLIVRPGGSRSWIIEYRPGAGGRGVAKRRLVIGDGKSMTPDEARSKAKGMLARVNLGSDPAAERAEERAAVSVADIARRWIEDHVEAKRKPATAKLYRAALETHLLPALGTKRAVNVSRQDLARVHTAIANKAVAPTKEGSKRSPREKIRGGPVIANRTIAVAKAMWTWALELGLLPEGATNPATGLEAFREKGRERLLSTAEMTRLGDALRLAGGEGLPWSVDEEKPLAKHLPKEGNRRTIFDPHSIAAIQLIFLTGARFRKS